MSGSTSRCLFIAHIRETEKNALAFSSYKFVKEKKTHCKIDTQTFSSTFSLVSVLQSVTAGPISHFRCIKQHFNLSLPVRKHCTSSGDFQGICCKAYATVREQRPSPPNTLYSTFHAILFFLSSGYPSHESVASGNSWMYRGWTKDNKTKLVLGMATCERSLGALERS